MLSRESPYVRLAYALTGLRSYAKIEMKNEALHRQTVRPNSVINKNSRNLGEKEGGYFCLFCVRMDGHDYRLPFEVMQCFLCLMVQGKRVLWQEKSVRMFVYGEPLLQNDSIFSIVILYNLCRR